MNKETEVSKCTAYLRKGNWYCVAKGKQEVYCREELMKGEAGCKSGRENSCYQLQFNVIVS